MKNFYYEREADKPYTTTEEYLQNKRIRVLEVIKPICDAYGIIDYDYIIDGNNEKLKAEDTYIGCCGNSIGAIVQELTGYIFVKNYVKERGLGTFKTQTLNFIKKYWIKENK